MLKEEGKKDVITGRRPSHTIIIHIYLLVMDNKKVDLKKKPITSPLRSCGHGGRCKIQKTQKTRCQEEEKEEEER